MAVSKMPPALPFQPSKFVLPYELGLATQLRALKHAPPPSRKMKSLVDAGFMRMPKPVEVPFRHLASGTGTPVH